MGTPGTSIRCASATDAGDNEICESPAGCSAGLFVALSALFANGLASLGLLGRYFAALIERSTSSLGQQSTFSPADF